ncbi:hypothetical protein OC861_006773, partial [Tilletia horrida]
MQPFRNRFTPRVPCRYYGTPTGCYKGDDCTFIHDQPVIQRAPAPQPQQPLIRTGMSRDSLAKQHLSGFQGATSDSLIPVTIAPAEAHTQIYPFLQGDFAWKHTKVMRKFAQLLAAAGSDDARWNLEERTNFLTRLTDPTKAGVLRVQDVLCAPTSAGSSAQVSVTFASGMMPVVMFLTSSTVISTTIVSSSNKLYSIVDVHLEQLVNKATEGIQQLMRDHGAALANSDIPSMSQIFKPLVLLVQEYVPMRRWLHMVWYSFKFGLGRYLDRFPMAAVQHFDLLQAFLTNLTLKIDEWVEQVTNSRFYDGISRLGTSTNDQMTFVQVCLKDRIDCILRTLAFANSTMKQPEANEDVHQVKGTVGEGQLQLLKRTFDPPGDLRDAGPRHNNDYAHIQEINVHPTSEEIFCTEPPFVPFNFAGAPHHLPQGSPERLLDVQFRLLREELLEPLRTSLVALSKELQNVDAENSKDHSQLWQLLQNGGGRFRAGENAVDLQVWNDGDLDFHDLEASDRFGVLSVLSFQCRQAKLHWFDKLLNPGALVAVLSSNGDGGEVHIALGLAKSRPDELRSTFRTGRDLTLKVRFFDSVAPALHFPSHGWKYQILAEVRGVLYESVTPFLENLRKTNANQLPFGQLLATAANTESDFKIPPPRYAQEPGFAFNLTGLLAPSQSENEDATLTMTIDQPSQEHARNQLKRRGIVDDSQADAVVDSLTRQVSIIQGPPGTGKSFTGVALINALLKSGIGRILVVCMTNHALDSLLNKILDQDLTRALVRIGTRSKDERIASYSLEELLTVAQQNATPPCKAAWWRFKKAQKKVSQEVKRVQHQSFSEEEILCSADVRDPDLVEAIFGMPVSMQPAYQDWISWNAKSVSSQSEPMTALDVFRFWAAAGDIQYRNQAASQRAARLSSHAVPSRGHDSVQGNRYQALDLSEPSDDGSDASSTSSPDVFTMDDVLPYEDSETSSDDGEGSDVQVGDDAPGVSSKDSEALPAHTDGNFSTGSDQSNRELNLNSSFTAFDASDCASWPLIEHQGDLDVLLRVRNIWTVSKEDRDMLLEHWRTGLRRAAIAKLEDECKKFEAAHRTVQEHHNSQRQQILSDALVIGATTTGAAKTAKLLTTAKPKVLVVEEAGQ